MLCGVIDNGYCDCLWRLNYLFTRQGLNFDHKNARGNFKFFVYCLDCGSMQGPQKVKVGSSNKVVTAKDIIVATGSVPFVPKGIEVDGTPYTTCFIFSLHDVIVLC